MDFDASAQVDALAKLPPEPPKPPPGRWNGWSAPLRGLAAGAAEVGAFAADAAKGYGQIMSAGGTERAGGMFSSQTEEERRESELQRFKLSTDGVDTTSEVGTALRDVSRDYRPDPATAGLAERLAFDLTRFLGKAVGYSVLGAGVPGAVALGADEAMTVSDDLMRQGVDKDTRMQAGTVAGVAAAAGVVLPVAAAGSIPKTIGLWALGGPGAFIAQQAATREILADADYAELSTQYDPLDPVGLLVSSLVPAGFAAWAVRGARVKPVAPITPARPALTPEQVDAVMTHNLTLARDVHEDSATPMVQELHEADLATKAIPETDRVEDLRGNSFDSMFEGYEKSADDLASMLEDMGFQTRRESSRVSMSEYIYAKTPDYAENDTGEPISGRELKFRLSNHTLPSSYEQVHFDVAVFDADNLRPDVGGDITDALRWASEASGVAPNGEAKRLIGERAAQKAAAANAEAARLAAANDARQQTLDLAHAFISRQPDGATIGVSKRKRMTATLDGKIIDTLDTFPRDWASGTQAEKGQAPKMAKADALVFLEGKGAAPANSRELGSHAPEGAGMQERPAVRADESGSLEGPAQSDSAGGGESKTTGQGGKSQDPHIASTLSSVEALKAQSPDLPVALREDGTPVTLSEELDAIRRQAREGTADTFATRMAASDDAAVRNVGEGIRRAADVLGPEQMAAITRAADTYMQAREAGTPIAKAVEDLNLPPEVTNLVAGIVENAHSAPRIEALAREVMKTVEDFKTTSAGVTADAVERLRTLTDEQITGAQAKAQKSNVEPMLASMQERIARIEQMVPDMVVRTDDTGQPVTVAKEMARIREEARKGTDTELGADDADLVSVAANCTLSVGA